MLEWGQREHNLRKLIAIYTFHGQLALLRDEAEVAQQWFELAGEQQAVGPMLFFEDPLITHVRLLLARGDRPNVAVARSLLEELVPFIETKHNTRERIQMLTLQALVSQRQGHLPEALELLGQALALGRPAGFVRTFADLPLVNLLQEMRKRQKARQDDDRQLDAYLQRLLAAMRPPTTQDAPLEELMRYEGLEPLTERELQVLCLLDKNLTNKEIARELVVTSGTVKVHTNNLYRKLSVNNRHAAIILSKSLGLLNANEPAT